MADTNVKDYIGLSPRERELLEARTMVHQANSTAADVPTLVTDFNNLLAKLQTAGLMANS